MEKFREAREALAKKRKLIRAALDSGAAVEPGIFRVTLQKRMHIG